MGSPACCASGRPAPSSLTSGRSISPKPRPSAGMGRSALSGIDGRSMSPKFTVRARIFGWAGGRTPGAAGAMGRSISPKPAGAGARRAAGGRPPGSTAGQIGVAAVHGGQIVLAEGRVLGRGGGAAHGGEIRVAWAGAGRGQIDHQIDLTEAALPGPRKLVLGLDVVDLPGSAALEPSAAAADPAGLAACPAGRGAWAGAGDRRSHPASSSGGRRCRCRRGVLRGPGPAQVGAFGGGVDAAGRVAPAGRPAAPSPDDRGRRADRSPRPRPASGRAGWCRTWGTASSAPSGGCAARRSGTAPCNRRIRP